jgi:hypothetical protein
MKLRIAAGLALAALAAVIGAPTAAVAAPEGTQTLETSLYSGTVAPGASQHRWWNNANPLSVAYVVGLSPKGASTTQDCQFEVTQTWYQQNHGGEREFHYMIKNVGTISCGTDILLYSLPDSAGAWNTGGVNPGQSVTKHWNNAPSNSTYVVGYSPSGATSTAPCRFETTREWYVRQPDGEKEFYFTLKNTGTIACSAEILLAFENTTTASTTPVLGPGGTASSTWNNNPATIAYIVGFTPTGQTPATPCQFELTRSWYAQVLNASGSLEKEFRQQYRNAGSITCSATKLLAWP